VAGPIKRNALISARAFRPIRETAREHTGAVDKEDTSPCKDGRKLPRIYPFVGADPSNKEKGEIRTPIRGVPLAPSGRPPPERVQANNPPPVLPSPGYYAGQRLGLARPLGAAAFLGRVVFPNCQSHRRHPRVVVAQANGLDSRHLHHQRVARSQSSIRESIVAQRDGTSPSTPKENRANCDTRSGIEYPLTARRRVGPLAAPHSRTVNLLGDRPPRRCAGAGRRPVPRPPS